MKIIKDHSLQIPYISLRDTVIFPESIKSVYVGRHDSMASVEKAIEKHNNKIFLITQMNPVVSNPSIYDLYDVGCIARVSEIKQTNDRRVVKVIFESLNAAFYDKIIDGDGYKLVNITDVINLVIEDQKKVETLINLIKKEFKRYVELSKIQLHFNLNETYPPMFLFNNISQYLISNLDTQVNILKHRTIDQYLVSLVEMIYANIENIQLEKKIAIEVKRKLDKNQKDFFLYEQMKEIQKELGNSFDDVDSYNPEELSKKMDSLGMPPIVKEKILKEQRKLLKMPPISQETGVIKNYIDTLFELPWKVINNDTTDLKKAKEILDTKHYSLNKVKTRILEFLAVRQLNPKTKGPILCFVGPPGTGKTSLSESVSRAINREFIRISLGGVRDEAEIRGHRRTYLGAMPGKIIQSMKKVKSINPVILLDEIDKMSSDFRGDPASALLEVLDPEQNCHFSDHFLEVPYDLSQVMFICTANSVQGIPYPLLDRMEIIYINSYTEEEKKMIAKNYILPKEKKENGIENIDLRFTKKGIETLIRNYTMEAGVRSLQRQIASICRKVAKKIVMENNNITKLKITSKNISKFLGKKKYIEPQMDMFLDVGVSHGLAWSELGGAILPIEIVLYPGKGNIILTGKLGEVMKESAQTAFSYIKSTFDIYDIKYEDFYKEYDLHIHFPEGAIPKDGPSGGIAIASAIVSCLTKVPIKSSVAMTGEITLTGKVLAIGGLREKSLAALRHGKKEIIIPYDNLKDLEELPKSIKKQIKFYPVKRINEVFELIFESSIYKEDEIKNKKTG